MVRVEALTLTAHRLDDLDWGSVLNYGAEVTEKWRLDWDWCWEETERTHPRPLCNGNVEAELCVSMYSFIGEVCLIIQPVRLSGQQAVLYVWREEDESTRFNTHQTSKFGRRRVVSVFEQTTSLHASSISVVSMDTRPTRALRRWAQTPFHPHHFMIGAGAGAQRGCSEAVSKEGKKRNKNIYFCSFPPWNGEPIHMIQITDFLE